MLKNRLFTTTVLFAGIAALVGCGAPSPDLAVTPNPTGVQAAVPTPSSTSLAVPTRVATPADPNAWTPPTALAGTPIPGAEATLTAAPRLRTAPITLTNKQGAASVMLVEIADTEQARELGLMFRPAMPPDNGMLFDFQQETESGFWMQNTILPLSIAFIKQDGEIVDIQDMAPLDITNISPRETYYYALETNQGYFRAHSLAPGDRVTLPGQQNSSIVPDMPDCDNLIRRASNTAKP